MKSRNSSYFSTSIYYDDPHFAVPDDKKIITNVILTLFFDDDDEAYEMPTSLQITYETEMKPVLIGTLTTTAGLDNDGYGGWNTWMELKSEGTKENPFPYTYTFRPTETEYDFMIGLENTTRPYIPSYGEVEGNTRPYVLYWCSANSGMGSEEDTRIPENLNDKRGVTQQFLGYYSWGTGDPARMDEPIRITNLDPNKVYQLRIDEPTDRSSSPTSSGVKLNGYVSLMEYSPELKALQLVKHKEEFDENGHQIYYTYDYTASLAPDANHATYRVALDENDNVVSCETIELDESVAYKPSAFQFTDKLFIIGTKPEWMKNERVDAVITGIKGEVIINGVSYPFDTELNEDPTNIYNVVIVDGNDSPFEPQKVSVDNYTYKYKNIYPIQYMDSYVDIVNEKEVTKYRIETGIRETTPIAMGDNPEFANVAVHTTGQLVVPTPASQEVEYKLEANNVAETPEEDAGTTVYLRFYDDELRGNAEYVEMPLNLENKIAVHSHDYHITFPYDNPNVTEEFKTLVRNGADDEGTAGEPHVAFQFLIDDGEGEMVETGIYSAYDGTPGFYNADLGHIYDKNVNGKPESAVRTMSMKQEPSIEEFPYIYDRWDDMRAEVDLTLDAPVATVSTEETNADGTLTNVYRAIRRIKPGSLQYQEYIYVTGIEVKNTLDEITGGQLTTGDDAKDRTTLYMVDVLDLNNPSKVNYRVLATTEELAKIQLDIAVSRETFTYEEWPGWNGTDFKINLSQLTGKAHPVNLRNVYLFPMENEGFNNSTDVYPEGEQENTIDKDIVPLAVQGEALAMSDEEASKTVYYAVTTPVAPLEVSYSEISTETPPTTTGVEAARVEVTTLARVFAGGIEIVSEGAEVYRADGVRLGSGCGRWMVSPGVYVVTKGNLTQKVMVK